MTGPAYYNEIEPFAAAWLRNLIAAELIAPGTVDERDIRDVRPSDLRGFARAHFFAGIGVWDYALGLAEWPDRRPVWTGSCPCQPFSAAGRGGGFADERHLWPAFFHLIGECRPATVLGEQVASKDGLQWLDLVHADLEDAGYAVGAADLCAAGVGAPHIRQRLWFVADSDGGHAGAERQQPGRQYGQQPQDGGADRWSVAEPAEPGSQGCFAAGQRADAQCAAAERGGSAGFVADAAGEQQPRALQEPCGEPDAGGQGMPARGCGDAGFWSDVDWLPCRDGKARPVEPGTFPLAHGAPARVGRLRAYGNCIAAPAAEAFIRAVLDAAPAGDPGPHGRDLRLSTTAETIQAVTGIFA